MNKLKIAAMVGAYAMVSSVSAAEMTLWNGADGSGKVSTGGYWFKYDDNAAAATPDFGPGASTSDFPTGSTLKDVVGPWFLEKGGKVDVTFTINPTTYKYPFAGIGFNWVQPEASHDISAQTGICLDYSITGTDVPIQIEIKVPNDAAGKPLDGDNARALKLKTSAVLGTPTTILFSTFTQEDDAAYYGTKLTVAEALKASSGLKFKAQLKTPPTAPKTVNLKIASVGWASECGISNSVITNAASGLKMAQSGRTLSFSGVASGSAKVEVINMQGQRVSSQVLGTKKSVSLSNLSNGMYMVRVMGESVDFSQRIVLQ